MKKIAWFAPILVLGPLALAVACDGGGPVDMDGTGGADGSGGNSPTGGSSNDGTGGSSDGTGGGTGGSNLGGMGGMGGMVNLACLEPSQEEIGMGGFGGNSSELLELCEARCSYAVSCGAAACDEADCVTTCAESDPVYYYSSCVPEYTALKACEVENLVGEDYGCDETYDIVFAQESGTAKCEDEWDTFNGCLYP